eukprot:364262-Chlamydomonas_euryale.AAC.17
MNIHVDVTEGRTMCCRRLPAVTHPPHERLRVTSCRCCAYSRDAGCRRRRFVQRRSGCGTRRTGSAGGHDGGRGACPSRSRAGRGDLWLAWCMREEGSGGERGT